MKRAHQLAIDAQQPGRILIILPRQLGDILLGSSLSFALRQSFPSAHISWLSHPMGRQLLTGHPALNEVRYHPVWKGKPWRNIIEVTLRPCARLLETRQGRNKFSATDSS